MITRKTHRRYPQRNWNYKAISTYENENGIKKEIIYHTLENNLMKTEGVEILSGQNHIVGSKDRSYAKTYEFGKEPKKYKKIVDELKRIHQSSKWSKEDYVNEN